MENLWKREWCEVANLILDLLYTHVSVCMCTVTRGHMRKNQLLGPWYGIDTYWKYVKKRMTWGALLAGTTTHPLFSLGARFWKLLSYMTLVLNGNFCRCGVSRPRITKESTFVILIWQDMIKKTPLMHLCLYVLTWNFQKHFSKWSLFAIFSTSSSLRQFFSLKY